MSHHAPIAAGMESGRRSRKRKHSNNYVRSDTRKDSMEPDEVSRLMLKWNRKKVIR